MTTVYTPLTSAQQQQQQQLGNNSTKDVAMTKPKRPLSSYNLFYRFKRQHIIELDKGSKKDDIIALVAIQPGLENTYPNIPTTDTNTSVDEINELRKTNIRNDMINNLCPRETSTRRHRKSNAMNGEMSFLELGKLMNSSWQSCDEFAKTVFNDLANEGREVYRQRMADYNLLTNEIAEDHHRNMIMSGTQPQQPQPQAGVAPQVYTSAPHGMMGGPLPSLKRKVSPTSLLQQQMGGVVSMGEGLSTKEWVQSMSNMLSNNNNSNSMMGHSQQQSSPVPYMGPQGMQGQFDGTFSPYQGLSRTHSPQGGQGGPGYRRLVTQDIKLLETNRNKLCANMKELEEELNAAKLRVRVYELEAQQKHQEELFREQMMRMQQASVASSASRGGTLPPPLPPPPTGVSPQDVNTGHQMGMMMSQEEMKEHMMRQFSNHLHNGDSPSASSNIMSGHTTLREVASHLTPLEANHSRLVSSLSMSSPSSQQDQSQDGLSWLASAASSIGGGGGGMSMSSMNQMPPLPLNSDNDQQGGSSSNKKQRLS